MKKIKSLKFNGGFSIFKFALLGVAITLAGILIFAVILKFVDVSSPVISFVNNIIKIISIFFIILCYFKTDRDRLMLKALILGVLYQILCFAVFSILNQSFSLGLNFLYDLLFVMIVSAISAILINLTRKRA